ncbi:MAG: hypothetical protein M1339_01595 [Bacteroidetes bacterium]|nr:hypothetical protein [Bacteroidota bacterium]
MFKISLPVKFNANLPNIKRVLSAINSSLRNIGVSVQNVATESSKVNAHV